MNSAWKWKTWGTVALIGLGFYSVLPGILGIPQQKEQLEAQGKPAPWFFNLLPDKGINLGLDLRGGIYVEMDVDLKEAIVTRLNIITQEIVRDLEKRDWKPESWEIKKEDLTLHATFTDINKKASALERLLKEAQLVGGNFEYVFEKLSETANPPTLVLKVPGNFQKGLKSEIIRQAVQSVRNRIDRYGLTEPNVQQQGDSRVVIELPGVKDPERALKVIQQAGQLEFKLVSTQKTPVELGTLIQETREKNNLGNGFSFEEVKKINELLANQLPKGTEIAFQLTRDAITGKVLGGTPYLLDQKAYVTGEMLQNARVDYQNNEPYVSLSFNPEGAKAFAALTKAHVKEQLAILLDGNLHSAPVIREPILNGQAQIDLGYGNRGDLMKEAQDLTLVLQEGALPARLTVATKTVVGPSLGQDSIDSSLYSLLVGMALVIVFMTIYYKWSGVLANLALIFNTLFIFSLLAMFQATLTLPGMAGIILSVGMAVDANVLIFERIREELVAGQMPRQAIDSGYGNAMRAILDSNITTVLAAVVLYQFGTGPIRGFAVTLIIGICCSMFTAIVMTRLAYDYFLTRKRVEGVSI